jgi:integrase/recombinase XerD
LYRSHDPVFVSFARNAGEDLRLCPTSVNEIVKAAAKQAGVDRRVSAHSLRYACATLALEGGAPVHQVQRHLRHRDIRTTLRYDRAREVRKNPTIEAIGPLEE